jgi:hypothetical protein
MPNSLVVHNSSPPISSVKNLSIARAKYSEWNGALTTKNLTENTSFLCEKSVLVWSNPLGALIFLKFVMRP